jgi:hypothetical protein
MVIKERIPESIKEELIQAVLSYDLVTLTLLHNTHNLGNNKLCCPNPILVPHYEAALDININVYNE